MGLDSDFSPKIQGFSSSGTTASFVATLRSHVFCCPSSARTPQEPGSPKPVPARWGYALNAKPRYCDPLSAVKPQLALTLQEEEWEEHEEEEAASSGILGRLPKCKTRQSSNLHPRTSDGVFPSLPSEPRSLPLTANPKSQSRDVEPCTSSGPEEEEEEKEE